MLRTTFIHRVATVMLACCLLAAGAFQMAAAAQVQDLYTASAELSENTAEAQREAYRHALGQVLVRVTGRLEAPGDPRVEALLNSAGRYVQQRRRLLTGELSAMFDGEALMVALREAGVPVWGSERPMTLVWLAVDAGRGKRDIVAAMPEASRPEVTTDEPPALLDHIRATLQDGATARGVPIVFPLVDTEDRERLSFTDLWGGFAERIRAASERYAPDAILVGRVRADDMGAGPVRWSLYFSGGGAEWRGVLEQGLDRIADTFADRFSVLNPMLRSNRLVITGVGSLPDYARVMSYLESLSVIDSLRVEQVIGDRLSLQVESHASNRVLRNTIQLGRVLQPMAVGFESDFELDPLRFEFKPLMQ